MAPSTPALIIDCDPGHDDVAAIVAAAHFGDVRGIVTVGGNAPLDRTTHNALVMRDLLRLDVPVHSGAARPLVREPQTALEVHGKTGLDGADLPEPSTALDGTDGVEFIVDTCRATEGLWLVPTGPLTNIALALRADPGLLDRIAGVSLMGGGRFGNMTSTAEFNIGVDPDAAAEVFAAFDALDGGGPPLIMAGLHLTHQFQLSPERIAAIAALPGLLAATLADLFTFFSSMYLDRHDQGSMVGAALHDPLAVLAITHPELFESVERHVLVETEGTLTAGQTVIDDRHQTSRRPANCTVLETVDADAAFALLLDAVGAFSRD